METLKRNLLMKLELEKTTLENDFVYNVEKRNTRYGGKIDTLVDILKNISLLENSIMLVHSYFKPAQQIDENIIETKEPKKE